MAYVDVRIPLCVPELLALVVVALVEVVAPFVSVDTVVLMRINGADG